MLYLLDASVLITANNRYYPIDQVPEFWEWLHYMGLSNRVKIPVEIIEEIKEGRKDKDLLYSWIRDKANIEALKLDEEVDILLFRRVVNQGYASDLTDVEVDQLGRDPFLVAYAMAKTDRCVVTTEVSKPKRSRQNRHLPDVCQTMQVQCCDPFVLNRELGFKTSWRP
ncbi:MAG: DUF4411 family protein [Candidatus Omnitrophota bacterium]